MIGMTIASLSLPVSFLLLMLATGLQPRASAAEPERTRPAGLDLAGFRLVWNDEFEGDRLDPGRWQAADMIRQGTSRWVPSLATVSNGLLRLAIRLTDDPVVRYASAGIRTRKDYDPSRTMFEQRYGYFEIRCRLPAELKADYWAAFWMMCGNVGDGTPDTRKGLEVDIMESFAICRKQGYDAAFHWNGYGRLHNSAGFSCGTHPELLDGRFHTFGMFWDKRRYVLYLDGFEVGRTDLKGLGSKSNGKTQSRGPCREPGYLKVSCEAAPWAGLSPGWESEMPRSDEFAVDYVRVFKGRLPAGRRHP